VVTLPDEEHRHGTLLQQAQAALRRREGSAASRGPTRALRAVQRLDRDTSGLLVFARTVAAQRHLQRQLAERTLERRYLALVHGHPGPMQIDTFLVRDRGDGLRGSWGTLRHHRGEPPADARPALTVVEPLERLSGAALVECRLRTGRQHQVRIHLAESGHPLLGEQVYVRDFLRDGGAPIPAPRAMLHAAALGFQHPRTGGWLRFEDPPPPDFAALLAALRSPAASGGAGRAPRPAGARVESLAAAPPGASRRRARRHDRR
jgi:23S rRNA pseudouridine1911/1915/1917 synthase